ncbi:MAG: polysaccharide ABC transporter ATP-binding protein, partial [Actinobacteria bacterium]|nr:polysaccharide ABC transporter ATP-binding protein [Actinomycetota bacterium]
MEPVATLSEVTKFYRPGPRYLSVQKDLWAVLGRRRKRAGKMALDNVSFQLARGESLGLIGANGAGKTTALKILSRVSRPSIGRVSVTGRVAALIDVGSGLHPELTGRQNVSLYGRILGLRRRDIEERFDQIVEFSELEQAIDSPVKSYSSGMQLRLGFSIAAHLEPDVILIDEAFTVGDASFQARCARFIKNLVRSGRSALLVSHDLSAVESLCDRCLLLEDGRLVSEGEPGAVIRKYLERARVGEESGYSIGSAQDELELVSVATVDSSGLEKHTFRSGEDVIVRLHWRARGDVRKPYVIVGITDGGSDPLIICSMLADGAAPDAIDGDTVIA